MSKRWILSSITVPCCGHFLRLHFRRSLVSVHVPPSGEERGLLSRTAAGNRAYYFLWSNNLFSLSSFIYRCVDVRFYASQCCSLRILDSREKKRSRAILTFKIILHVNSLQVLNQTQLRTCWKHWRPWVTVGSYFLALCSLQTDFLK